MLSNSAETLEKIINDLHREILEVGLKISMKQTKIMYSYQLGGRQVIIRNAELELVEEYICLGQTISASPGHEKQSRKVRMRWSAFGKRTTIMNSNLPLSLKRKVYNQFILKVLMYASETCSVIMEIKIKERSEESNGRKKAVYNIET